MVAALRSSVEAVFDGLVLLAAEDRFSAALRAWLHPAG